MWHVGHLSVKQRLVQSHEPLYQSGTVLLTRQQKIFILSKYELYSVHTDATESSVFGGKFKIKT